LEGDSTLGGKDLTQQFEKLLLKPVSAVVEQKQLQGTKVLIIDALDECENEQDIRMILTLLPRLVTVTPLRLRVFVASRPELPVQLGFKRVDGSLHQDIKLEEAQAGTIENDIRIYFEHQFAEIRENESVRSFDPLPEPWPRSEHIEKLVSLAVPLLVFASTICRYVSERNPRKRLWTVIEGNKSYALPELGKLMHQFCSRFFSTGRQRIVIKPSSSFERL